MIWFVLTFLLFVILLVLPLAWAGFWYFRSKDSVLLVRQERKRDPRYFARSFDEKFQDAWEHREDGKIRMSKEEDYFLADGKDLNMLPKTCEKLVVADMEDLVLPAQVRFAREICAQKNVTASPETMLRAVRTKGSLILGRCSTLDRWADADGTVAVYEDCNAGISITSAKAISIGENCSFRRLFAPVIHLGAYPGDNTEPSVPRDQRIYGHETIDKRSKNKRRINSSQLEDSGMVEACVVTDSRITIEENIIVMGDIHTRKSIHLAAGSVVCGNIFAGKHIYLDNNTTVLGSVFSQGNITMDDGVVIGQEGRTSSVIARARMTTGKDCFVYGYISNEGGGIACPVDKDDRANQQRPSREETFLEWPEPKPELTFAGAEAFREVDSQGFRHMHTIRKAVIPEGVTSIADSMFFDCANIEELVLPESLKEIGEFAFADCKSLRVLDLSGLGNLRKIGHSAFDGCTGLEKVVLPAGIRCLGAAAFCGCTALKELQVPEIARIREIGSHCFLNCPVKTLPKVWVREELLPKTKKAQTQEEGAVTGV